MSIPVGKQRHWSTSRKASTKLCRRKWWVPFSSSLKKLMRRSCRAAFTPKKELFAFGISFPWRKKWCSWLANWSSSKNSGLTLNWRDLSVTPIKTGLMWKSTMLTLTLLLTKWSTLKCWTACSWRENCCLLKCWKTLSTPQLQRLEKCICHSDSKVSDRWTNFTRNSLIR